MAISMLGLAGGGSRREFEGFRFKSKKREKVVKDDKRDNHGLLLSSCIWERGVPKN